MDKKPKSTRLACIYHLLRSHTEESALTIQEICKALNGQRFKVTTRTVRRDLDELSTSYGLCSTEDYPTRFYIASDYQFKHQLQLNEDTLEVLVMALNALKQTSHSYFDQYASEAEMALFASLSDQTVKKLIENKKNFRFDFSISGKPHQTDHKEFNLILRAIREKKVIQCLNNSPYKDAAYNKRPRKFAPLLFILTSATPYLVVKDLDDNFYKKIRVTRLTQVKLTETTFQETLPKDFDLGSAVGGWGGLGEETTKVEVLCDLEMANYFQEKVVHQSQRVEAHSTGKFKISFNCALSNELVRLIASFGGHIHSVAPAELKKGIEEIWTSGIKKAS